MLGGPSLRLGDTKECLNIPSGIGWGGNDTGRLVTWEFPLRTDSASWTSLKSFIQFTSFCNSCNLPDNSIIVFWSSMCFRLAIVSKVELWNFRNSSISVRLCWRASRNSNFCRQKSKKESALFFCVSCLEFVMTDFFAIFRNNRLSLLFKWSPNLCVRAVTLIRFPWSIVSVLNSGVYRKSDVSFNHVSCDIRLPWFIDHSLSIKLPWSIEHYRRRLTDWHASWYAVVDLSTVCRSEHLAECQVIHVLVRGRDHEGEGNWRVVEVVEGKELGLITCGAVKTFKVSSLSSAAEQRRFAVLFVYRSSLDSSRWKRKTGTDRRKRKK